MTITGNITNQIKLECVVSRQSSIFNVTLNLKEFDFNYKSII